jgi:replication-associated recombination protein RarA
MLCKRLIVICLEDVDNLGQPAILPYVHSAMTLAKEWWDSDPARAGKSRLAIANVVLMLASARKSRLADHFQCVAVWGALLEGRVPSVPDFALDHHTAAGRRMGRTIDFFLAESTRCVPAIEPDAYRDEAARLWKLRESRSKTTPARDQGELQIDVDE